MSWIPQNSPYYSKSIYPTTKNRFTSHQCIQKLQKVMDLGEANLWRIMPMWMGSLSQTLL